MTMPEHAYVLGHGAREVRRLELQAALLAPGTARILAAAGLGPGLSVLDIGSGAGDVAMLAAGLVGPTGSVLGIDREPSVLERARARAGEAGLAHLRFEAATLDALSADRTFDFVVARYVLGHQPDRVAFLRQAAARARPGGVLAFIEAAAVALVAGGGYSIPPVPLFDAVKALFPRAADHAGIDISTGMRLPRLFHEAGLPEPSVLQEVVIGGAASSVGEFACLTAASMMPVLEAHGVTTAAEADLDAMPARIREAASAAHSQLIGPSVVGAWARIG